jgi:hypothetical protein
VSNALLTLKLAVLVLAVSRSVASPLEGQEQFCGPNASVKTCEQWGAAQIERMEREQEQKQSAWEEKQDQAMTKEDKKVAGDDKKWVQERKKEMARRRAANRKAREQERRERHEREAANKREEENAAQKNEKTEDNRAALGTLMDSAGRLGHSSDDAMDHMANSSRQFTSTLNRMESERRGIDPSPAFKQGASFHHSTLPYGIQGAEVPVEELNQYVPHN